MTVHWPPVTLGRARDDADRATSGSRTPPQTTGPSTGTGTTDDAAHVPASAHAAHAAQPPAAAPAGTVPSAGSMQSAGSVQSAGTVRSAGTVPSAGTVQSAGAVRFSDTAEARAGMLPEPPLPGYEQLPGYGQLRLSDPRFMTGIGEIAAVTAEVLDDDARPADVMPVITEAARRWLEGQVRAGELPASAGEVLEDLARAVYDRRYELGPVTDYLRDPKVENVDINGCDHVWITYASGERVAGPPVAATDEALVSMIRIWATRGGQTARDFSAASPLVNVALSSGARLTASMSVTPRPSVSLRRHGQVDATLSRLVQLGTVDTELAGFLAAAVRSRCNIIVTGGVNAGKTTLLRALASEIPPGERIATLETEYELYLHDLPGHPDVIAFEAREPNSEGAGGITVHDLVAHALRHNPRRILVGEVRRDEIMPMLEAMNSGQDGSMCTLHANSPSEAFDRVLILGLRGGLALAERAIHILVGMAVDLIVHIRRGYDGTRTVRYVSEVLEVLPPGDTERPAVNRLFLPHSQTGRAVAAHTPSAGLLARLIASGFDPASLDRQRSAQTVTAQTATAHYSPGRWSR